MLTIKQLAQKLVKAIEYSDRTYGVGDRSSEENEAIEDLKLALEMDAKRETHNN